MEITLAFISAIFLELYDILKRVSLKDNAMLPILLLNTIFSTIIFLSFLVDYLGDSSWFSGTILAPIPFNRTTQILKVFHCDVIFFKERNTGRNGFHLDRHQIELSIAY